MKNKVFIFLIYLILLSMLLSILYISLMVNPPKVQTKIIYKEKEVKSKIKEVIVYKDRIIYKENTPIIIQKGKKKEVYRNTPEKIHFGLSIISGYLNSNIKDNVMGLGFKLRYQNCYSQTEFLTDNTVLFSMGYEF